MEKIIITNHDALTVIDGQNTFILRLIGELYVAGVAGEKTNEEIMEGINSLARKPFGHLATTEDDHPGDHIEHTIYGNHGITGTFGQQYHYALADLYEAADEHIRKGQSRAVISLSIETSFQFPLHIINLRRKNIKRVFLTGWAYTHCVGWSAVAYAVQGFETYIVRNLTRSVPPPYGNPEAMKALLTSPIVGVKEIFLEDIA